MNQETIVRAWEDPQFRAGLTPDLLASLPMNPSGPSMYELKDDEIRNMIGGGPLKGYEGGGGFTNANTGIICIVGCSLVCTVGGVYCG